MSGNSTSSPPSEGDSSSSPPPPSKDDPSSPPPPPSKDDQSSPPSQDSSPPPPSPPDSSSPPPPNNNNNGGSDGNKNNNSSGDNNNSNNGSNNNSNGNNNNDGNNNNNNGNNNNGSNNNNNNNGNNTRSPPPPPPPSSSNKNSHGPPSPPPPARSHGKALAPPHKSSSSHDSSSGDNSSDINTKALIGGVAGAAALLLLFMIACLCCCRKKKRKSHDQMYYYRDNSHGNKGNAYYNSAPHSNRMNPQSTEYHVKMPQSGAVSSEHGWAVPPPPPPPMTCSSDLSSAAFSGPHQPPLPPPHPALALGFNKSTFSYDDLAAATGGFAKANLLGQGGFGYVHKGVLPNGKEIAVKSLKSGSGQGEREFQAEVDIISRVHHRHLVSLVGYCIAGTQRMLVYEFVRNNTLEHHLHGAGVAVMDWSSRIRIALGSAKGFAYLHEDCHPRIIHRDIKTANILLDEHYEAKVADFGLAKLSNENYTHVSTRIMGTFGYLAPEYASSGKLTEKSDVYSYGVMLLELITGRRPVDVSSDDDTLIDWARPILMRATEGGSYDELVDPRLENNYDPEEMLRTVACAAACIRHSARRRPKMSQIVRALEGDVSLEDLNEAVKPGHSSNFGSSGSSEYDGSYSVDMKKFRKAGLSSSQEYTSSEHGVTGEFVHSNGGESREMRPNRSRMHSP